MANETTKQYDENKKEITGQDSDSKKKEDQPKPEPKPSGPKPS